MLTLALFSVNEPYEKLPGNCSFVLVPAFVLKKPDTQEMLFKLNETGVGGNNVENACIKLTLCATLLQSV